MTDLTDLNVKLNKTNVEAFLTEELGELSNAAFVDMTDLLEDVLMTRFYKQKCQRELGHTNTDSLAATFVSITMLEEENVWNRAYNWATKF